MRKEDSLEQLETDLNELFEAAGDSGSIDDEDWPSNEVSDGKGQNRILTLNMDQILGRPQTDEF